MGLIEIDFIILFLVVAYAGLYGRFRYEMEDMKNLEQELKDENKRLIREYRKKLGVL